MLALCSVSCAAVESASMIAPVPQVDTQASVTTDGNPENWSERTSEVLVNALNLTGVKYKYGGNSPEIGFDCSGFVRYVFSQATSLTLPHSTLAISQLGKTIPKNEIQPGDLVFFKTIKNAISHVGIYMGNNRFIHSPSAGGQVRVESMTEGYWARHFSGAQRLDITKSSLKE
ncbi:MAG: glycoside hydrolase [Betaproteobacteria bacterium HGW-Betaproteobacteria-20]|nr:MAG: glycoside hydrolase [Betaproteobacteria bacterium HGW-Betaproteobacteria-20]